MSPKPPRARIATICCHAMVLRCTSEYHEGRWMSSLERPIPMADDLVAVAPERTDADYRCASCMVVLATGDTNFRRHVPLAGPDYVGDRFEFEGPASLAHEPVMHGMLRTVTKYGGSLKFLQPKEFREVESHRGMFFHLDRRDDPVLVARLNWNPKRPVPTNGVNHDLVDVAANHDYDVMIEPAAKGGPGSNILVFRLGAYKTFTPRDTAWLEG